MKKLLWIPFVLLASPIFAQVDQALPLSSYAVQLNGGTPLPVGYLTIQDEGSNLPQESVFNCVGAGIACTDDAANFRTLITISGGGGSTPTGTGFTHITAGVQDGAAKLVDTADINNNQVTLAKFATQAANTILGNATSGAAVPTALAMPSCSDSGGNHLNWVTNTGFACGTSSSASGGAFDPNTTWLLYEEFNCGNPTTSGTVVGQCLGTGNIINTNSASGSATTGDANSPGVAELGTVATTNGISVIGVSGVSNVLLADTAYFQTRVKVNRLSTTGDNYALTMGWCDNSKATTTECTDGVWFGYTDTGSTPNWSINTDSNRGGGGSSVNADCGIAVAATTWTKLRWVYDVATGVHFYVNNVECSNSPITTQLPTATGRETQPYFIRINKIAGTTASNLDIDYFATGGTISR